MTINLLDFDLDGLAALCEQLGEKRFRAAQLFRWIHQRGATDFAQMTDLAKSLRDKLAGASDLLQTVRGVGFRLADADRPSTVSANAPPSAAGPVAVRPSTSLVEGGKTR